MKGSFNLNSKEAFDEFLIMTKGIDHYLRSMPLKEDIELKVKIEVETRYGTIFKIERWQSELFGG